MKDSFRRWLRTQMALCVAICVLQALTLSCGESSQGLAPDATLETPSAELAILALGDSYTIGTGVRAVWRWPVQLVDSLAAVGIEVANLKIIAETGWTTTDLLHAIDERGEEGRYDLVTLLIGVNNLGLEPTIFETEFEELVDVALARAHQDTSRVLVLTIPDFTATPLGSMGCAWCSRQKLENLNTIAREIAASRGVAVIDITNISRLAASDPTLVARDELHFSGEMYALWAEKLRPIVAAILAPRSHSCGNRTHQAFEITFLALTGSRTVTVVP